MGQVPVLRGRSPDLPHDRRATVSVPALSVTQSSSSCPLPSRRSTDPPLQPLGEQLSGGGEGTGLETAEGLTCDPCGPDEVSDARWPKIPVKPSQAETDQHNVSHLPFRSWCRYCVRGRGQSVGHFRVDHSAEQIPTIEIDYGFLGDKDSPATDLPVLCGRDRQSKTVWSSPVPCKGVEDHPHGSKRLKEWLEETGYRRVILKSDQEPAIVSVINAVKNGWAGELIPESASKESHEKSNGAAEVTVKQIHGLARSVKEQLEDKAKVKLPQKHPVLAWLIKYVGVLISLFAKGPDGFTPYFRLKGKHWRVPLPLYGECVEFKVQTRHKLESRWAPGVYLGIRRKTSEKLVGTADTIYVVQSIRRKPQDEAWDGDLLMSIKGTPWLPNPKEGESKDLPLPIVLVPEVPEEPAGPAEAYDREA